MRVILSAAVTADGYMDDNTSDRLVISTAGDWAAVHALRASCDAIMVGAETLRRDNPSLGLRDEGARSRRVAEGLRPDITKVTVTASGNLDAGLRFFTAGDADRVVFSTRPLPELEGAAEVVVMPGGITPAALVTALERRGIRRLMVEGGARILHMFLDSGLADEFRLAVNPSLTVGERGVARFRFTPCESVECRREEVDGMEVRTYIFRKDRTDEDRAFLRQAIEVSRMCAPCDTCYRVGAVIRTAAGEIFTGYTHESSPTHHAEQEAIKKALQTGAELRGADIYTSMEPCSKRMSEPESCTRLIIRHGFARVVFALYEPDCFVCCRGAETLREHGIETRAYTESGDEVMEINSHLRKR